MILLGKYGIHPNAVVGHSSGEIAAAFASGLITANEAMLISYYRGQAVAQLDVVSHPGAMAAVGLGQEATVPYLLPGAVVGCENSPSSTTITGDAPAVKSVMQAIKTDDPDVFVRELRVDRAYHSRKLPQSTITTILRPLFSHSALGYECLAKYADFVGGFGFEDHMETISSPYHDLLKGKISPKAGKVPFFSSVTGDVIVSGEEVGPEYWVRNLVSPVCFSTSIAKIAEVEGERKLFLEIGPHSALSGPLRQNLESLGLHCHEYVSTLTRGNDSQADILKCAGSLWLHGLPLAYESITGHGRTLVDLPLYPWHYEQSLWHESRLSTGYRFRKFPHHDLLGSRVIESTDEYPFWRNILRPDLFDWLLQYETSGGTIFPAMGFICMAGEAVQQVTTSQVTGFTVRNVKVNKNLLLNPGKEVEVITQFRRLDTDQSMGAVWYEFSVSSLDSSECWVKHATGQVSTTNTFTSTIAAPELAVLPRLTSPGEWYTKLRSKEMRYGPRFTGLKAISAHVMERRALGTAINCCHESESSYTVHPTTLDYSAQLLQLADVNRLTRRLVTTKLPTYIGRMTLRPAALQAEITMLAQCQNESRLEEISGTVVATCDGEIIAEVEDLRLSPADNSTSPHQGYGKTRTRLDDGVLVWKEDLNLLDASSLIHPVEDRSQFHGDLDRFAAACIVEAAEHSRDVKPARPHLVQYAA